MENFLFAANGVLPVFLVMAIGCFLRYKNILSKEFYDGASRFVFLIATPALIFNDVATVDFSSTFDLKFIGSVIGILVAFIIALWILVPLFVKDRVKAGAIIHCSYRSNFAILGLPLLKNVLDIAYVPKAEILLAFGVPVFNVIAVICLAYWSQTTEDYKKIIKNIVTNPLIIGAVSGLLFSLLKIPVPQIAVKSISFVGNTALGLGLIVLGASFDFKKFVCSLKDTMVATLLKIVISPIVGLGTMYMMGFRGGELIIALIFFGSSTAVNSFIMAKEMGSDANLTSGIVVSTTGLSVITLFAGLYLLKSFGWV